MHETELASSQEANTGERIRSIGTSKTYAGTAGLSDHRGWRSPEPTHILGAAPNRRRAAPNVLSARLRSDGDVCARGRRSSGSVDGPDHATGQPPAKQITQAKRRAREIRPDLFAGR